MTWLSVHTKPAWPLWRRFLVFGGLLTFLPLLIIIIVVLVVVLRRHNNITNIAKSSFNVTYVIINDIDLSISTLNLNLIDLNQLSRNFENNLQLSTKNSLQLEKIYGDTTYDKLFQKKTLKCDYFLPSANDYVLIFQFHLEHSSSLLCQNQSYVNEFFSTIYKQFQDISYFSIELNYVSTTLYLCSINGFPNSEISSTGNNLESSSLPRDVCTINSTDSHNKWTIVANMFESLIYHSSTYISQDNSVLITGGIRNGIFYSDTIEKYIVVNQSFVMNSNNSMKIKRDRHTADLLPLLGLVLFTGATATSTVEEQTTAELLDPISGKTTSIQMLTNRRYPTSVVIPLENKIFFIGGHNYSSTILSTGDLFNGTCFVSILNTMNVQRIYHTATYIPTINKILITGGRNHESEIENTYNTIEFYDVASNMFEVLPNVTMSIARARHTATYIPSPINKILIIGGENNDTYSLNSYELFDVATLSFIRQGSIKYGRYDHHAILLNNNNDILIADGVSNDLSIVPSEIFNVRTMSSCETATMIKARTSFTATLIPSTDQVLICGGREYLSNIFSNCELYIS